MDMTPRQKIIAGTLASLLIGCGCAFFVFGSKAEVEKPTVTNASDKPTRLVTAVDDKPKQRRPETNRTVDKRAPRIRENGRLNDPKPKKRRPPGRNKDKTSKKTLPPVG